jgi:cysteine desulfurase
VRVYLDHNASAPLRPEARVAMEVALDVTGNPSSAHREGVRARAIVERARSQVAALVAARPAEIVFTSGATEANGLALRGGVAGRTGAVVVSAIEHASVLATTVALDRPVHTVAADGDARVSLEGVVAACDGAALVSVGLANGEVGTVAPVTEIARALAGRGIVLHTDAAQAAGRIPIDVVSLGVDLLSLSGHKLGGPTGVGALWVRGGFVLRAGQTGGPQEHGRRAGTENVVGIAGFGAAAEAARRELDAASARMDALRSQLWEGIRRALPDARLNGPADGPRLPNTLNVSIPGVAGESLLVLLDLAGVAASLGSACAAGSPEPSHVLLAMGRTEAEARNGLRLSLGPTTTGADVAKVLTVLPDAVAQIRSGRAA